MPTYVRCRPAPGARRRGDPDPGLMPAWERALWRELQGAEPGERRAVQTTDPLLGTDSPACGHVRQVPRRKPV